MTNKVIILSSVVAVFAVMIIAFKGCNDAIDNGVFKDEAQTVLPATEEETASSEAPVRSAEANDEGVRFVETYGAFGLLEAYNVDIRVKGENSLILTYATGYLGHTTKCDLSNLMGFPAVDGTIFFVRIQTILTKSQQWKYTGCYRYQHDGATLYMDVKGGSLFPLKIENIHTSR